MSAPVSLGRIWAKLCDETHNWSEIADRVDDLPHYGISIDESEGDFPVLEIAFENQGIAIDDLVGDRPRLLLSVDRLDADGRRVDTQFLFDGVLDDAGEVELGGEDVTLRYEARRVNWEALRNALLAGIGLPLADPCAGDLTDPVERLDATPTLVCWSRMNRNPVLSSAVVGGGGTAWDIGRKFRQGTMRVRRRGKPLGRVDVVLSAQWTESRLGEFDVGAMVEDEFGPLGISTFTPESLGGGWKQPGDDIGGGYTVSDSAIQVIGSPEGAVAELVAAQAASAARTFRPGAQQPQQVRMRRTWLKQQLLVTATSQVKRTEEVRFSVINGGQGASTDVERIEIKLDRLALDLDLADWQPDVHYGQNAYVRFAGFVWRSLEPHDSTTSLWVDRRYIDDDGDTEYRWELVATDGSPLGSPGAQSFFNTARGRLSIDHAVLVATKTIAYSQRNWEIEFEVDAFDMLGISCRDTVRVVAPGTIPGTGAVAIGKVRQYTFRFSASEATCVVVLAVSSGSGLAGGAGGSTVSFHNDPVFRVGYQPPAYLPPFAPGMGIASVEVVNGPEDQIAHVEAAAAAGRDLGKALLEVPTAIRVSTLPTGGGETFASILVAVSPYQGFRGISAR